MQAREQARPATDDCDISWRGQLSEAPRFRVVTRVRPRAFLQAVERHRSEQNILLTRAQVFGLKLDEP